MDGGKRYVNDDRFRVDGDKKYAFTSVCVYNCLRVDGALIVYINNIYILAILKLGMKNTSQKQIGRASCRERV